MLPQSEVFEAFRRWQDKGTQLRVDAQFHESKLSVEGTIDRVEEPFVSLDLAYRGYIEFRLDETWRYGSPEAMEIPSDERAGEAPRKSRRYEYGETITAVNTSERYVFFMEIVRPLN